VRERASGIGLVVEQLVRRAPLLAPDLDFLLLKHPRATAPLCNAPNVIERVVRWEANGPVTLFCLPRLVDLSGVDLFHAPFNILPHGLKMPSVATVHDLMWLKRPELAGSGAWGRVEALFYGHGIRRALEHATRILTVSSATLADIRTFDQRAYGRTSVVPPAVLEDFRPLAGAWGMDAVRRVREKWLRGASRYVIAVGQSSPYKNHEAVLRSFATAFADAPEFKLVVVQRLGDDAPMRRLATHLGLLDRVVLLGEIPRADLVALYNGAALLCHPSLWEGFGLPLVEAMACGCPVVTSPCASMPEVAGHAALYAMPDDPRAIAHALRRIAFDPVLARALRERGLARVRALPSWDDFARAHLEVYRLSMEAGATSDRDARAAKATSEAA
jgi:glycosyltransferase involved in cell wall biosynthesis